MPKFTKEDISAIIADEGLEQLTAKTVRVKLEAKLGLESGALKADKEEISNMIDECINEKEGGDDDQEEEEEEEEEEKPKAKKAKTTKEAASENPNKGKMSCKTRSGEDAPKNVKKMQESMKMSAKKFLETATAVEFDVDGNTLRGEPRSFSSGAMGWYLGGKVEIDVGSSKVLAAPHTWQRRGTPDICTRPRHQPAIVATPAAPAAPYEWCPVRVARAITLAGLGTGRMQHCHPRQQRVEALMCESISILMRETATYFFASGPHSTRGAARPCETCRVI